MNTIYKIATLTLTLVAVSVSAFSQKSHRQSTEATAQNLVRGVVGPVGVDSSWAGYSVENLIPGSGLYPITSTTTVFYFGFVGGTEADVNNMVLYTTNRGSLKITAVTPVKLGGVSNPVIQLTNTSVCPTQPLSAANPCIVRFDPTSITLTPSSDYYLMVSFTTSTNNQTVSATQPAILQSSLSSNFFGATDATHLTVGQSLPGVANRGPNFLMYVMTN